MTHIVALWIEGSLQRAILTKTANQYTVLPFGTREIRQLFASIMKPQCRYLHWFKALGYAKCEIQIINLLHEILLLLVVFVGEILTYILVEFKDEKYLVVFQNFRKQQILTFDNNFLCNN